LKKKNLYAKLNLIFGLFFFFPVLGFIFFSIKYGMLKDRYVPLFFLGILIFSFAGFTILKNLFDKITRISEQMSSNYLDELSDDPLPHGTDELHQIVQSFGAIERRFHSTFNALEKKSSEI
jgi:signal transduction histidine kinase